MVKRALVLSGGGIFGAWQAGAWSILSSHFRPDLIVGASVGSLNGYAIAAGCTPRELLELWRRPQAAGFRQLPETIRSLVGQRPLQTEFAVVLVDVLRMREDLFAGEAVTWKHLLASCSVPVLMRPQRIGANWYVDGGLLHALPVRAAVELGAKEILGLNPLHEFPMPALGPFVRGFRRLFAKDSAAPRSVSVTTVIPRQRLGSLGDASFWNAGNVERWYAQGASDAAEAITAGAVRTTQNISTPDCLQS